MRLSGLVFLVIGALVAGASWVLIARGQKMHLFLFVGVVMAIFGLWRALIDRRDPSSGEHRLPRRSIAQAQRTEHLAALNQRQHHAHEIPRVCSTCGTRNHPNARFCGYCGARL
jgi:membrane protein implicated in regulation of membrane protease activity